MVISVANHKTEVEIYKLVSVISGDPTVGLFDTAVQIIFDDGYTVRDKEDYDYLISETKAFIENLYGENSRCYLYDVNDNEVWP